MSLEFLSPGAILTCDTDGCDTEMEWTDWIEFSDILQEMKDAGWKSKKVGDEWEHYCSDCSDEDRRHGQ